jgi:hypothetical protein
MIRRASMIFFVVVEVSRCGEVSGHENVEQGKYNWTCTIGGRGREGVQEEGIVYARAQARSTEMGGGGR